MKIANNLNLTQMVVASDITCSDNVAVSNPIMSYVTLGGGDDTFNLVTTINTNMIYVCGDYCSCKLNNLFPQPIDHY
jgi:hypothetical protein